VSKHAESNLRETDGTVADQEKTGLSWKPSSPLVHIMSQLNPVHIIEIAIIYSKFILSFSFLHAFVFQMAFSHQVYQTNILHDFFAPSRRSLSENA
jgi:hypothetical protein